MSEWSEEQYPHKQLTERIIGAAIKVHRALGPGLLESAYEECLADELTRSGLAFTRQEPLPVVYEGRRLDCGYRLDIVVENSVILELKCVDKVMPIHEAQLLTYLRLARVPVGLLINFNVVRLLDGVTRRAVTHEAPCSDLSVPSAALR